MNAVLGFADLLQCGYRKDEQELQRHLTTTHTPAAGTCSRINDVLDLANLESGWWKLTVVSRMNGSSAADMRSSWAGRS
jgi:hypothetical protein